MPKPDLIEETAIAASQIEFVLDEIIKLHAECDGVLTALWIEYVKLAGLDCFRVQVERWVSLRPGKRNTPHLDKGMTLAIAAATVLNQHEETPFPRRAK